MLERLETALRLGATDNEAALLIGMDPQALRKLSFEDEEVSAILQIGNGAADARVEASLYRRAIGYTRIERKVVAYQGGWEIAEYEVDVDPEPSCIKFWLERRKPEQWGQPGAFGGALTIEGEAGEASHVRINFNIRGANGLVPLPETYLKAQGLEVEDAEVVE